MLGNAFLVALLVFVVVCPSREPHLWASATEDIADDDDDFLAEILAEEARVEEEHARLEAEAREFEAMKAREFSGDKGGGGPGMGGGGMGGGGGPRMRPQGNMPKGANVKFDSVEDELRKKEEAAKAKNIAEEEARAAKEAEKRREERERKFQADLAKMDAEQKKKAQKQKKRDAAIVRRILKASGAERHYAVLGLRNWDIKVGPLHLFHVNARDVKRAYRNLARTVHPDKNRDGRAEEAFHAVENSAALLGDDEKRKEYDRKRKAAARRRRKEAARVVSDSVEVGWKGASSVWIVVKRVLGPFKTPILVLGSVII